MPRKNYILPNFFATVHGELPFKPTNDYMFKKLFLKNQKALKVFLAALLGVPPSSIHKIQILNPELLPEQIFNKQCILDLHLLVNDKHRVNLEMQNKNENTWTDRSVIYLLRSFDSLLEGDNYDKLTPTTQVGILNYDLFPEENEFYAHYKMINVKNHKIYNDKVELCVLNLNQINLATEEDIARGIDLWARFFKATTWEDLKMLAEEKMIFAECAHTMHNILKNQEEYLYLQARIEGERVWAAKEQEVQEAQAERDVAVSERDAAVSERDAAVSERDVAVSERDAAVSELTRLRTLLEANGINTD